MQAEKSLTDFSPGKNVLCIVDVFFFVFIKWVCI